MGGCRACASVFREDGVPKDGDDLILGTQVNLTARVVQSAGSRRWRLRGWAMRGCGTQGSRYRATRDRTPEAEGWGSERAFEPRLCNGPSTMV